MGKNGINVCRPAVVGVSSSGIRSRGTTVRIKQETEYDETGEEPLVVDTAAGTEPVDVAGCSCARRNEAAAPLAATAETPMIKSETAESTNHPESVRNEPNRDDRARETEHPMVKSELVEWTKRFNRRSLKNRQQQEKHQRRWYWHIAEDGSFSTVGSSEVSSAITTATTTTTTAAVAPAVPPTRRDGSSPPPPSPERTVAGCPERSTSLLPFPKRPRRDAPDPAGGRNRNFCSGANHHHHHRGRWRWLLEPDGSHATAIPPSLHATRKKRPRDPGACAATTTTIEGDLVSSASGPRRRRDTKRASGSWYWLLANDGRPATVDASTQSSMIIGTKRRRPSSEPSFPTPSRYHCCKSEEDTNEYRESDEDESNLLDHEEHEIRSLDSSQRWKQNFQRLVSYKQKHNTADVPTRMPILGNWVNMQRRYFEHGKLSKKQIAQLESVGFSWRLLERTDWTEMYNHLVIYSKKHNTVNVPKGASKLGHWVQWQRRQYKNGKLPKERVTRLESIGFVWKIREASTKIDWHNMYDRLVDYKNKFGTTRVPQLYKDDPGLGKWVHRQRCRCKEKHRVDLLNEIGFEWLSLLEIDWMKMYNRLVAYKKKFHNTRVPRAYEEDPKLGIWVLNQRTYCKEKHRVALLNNIGFEWNPSGRRIKPLPTI